MKHILNPDFEYIPSHSTDIKKRFDAIRRRQKREAEKAAAAAAQSNVKPLKQAKG